MNKIRLTIVVWATLLALSAHAQQNIERLLPAFATLENIKVTESVDNGTWSQYEAPFYSVKIENVPIKMIPSWLVDSLIIAFEKELPLPRRATVTKSIANRATLFHIHWLTMVRSIQPTLSPV